MSEVLAQKQQEKKGIKAKINWKEIAMQTASFVGVALASGFLSQAGANLFQRTFRGRKTGTVIPLG